MKYIISILATALLLSCGGSEIEKSKAAYMKAAAGTWKVDIDFVKKELESYTKHFVDLAKENPDKRVAPMIEEYFGKQVAGWSKQMEDWEMVLTEDGKRTDIHGGVSKEGRFGFSPGLDSLYMLANDGSINYRFALEKLNDKELIYIRPMQGPNEGDSYNSKLKYVKKQGDILLDF